MRVDGVKSQRRRTGAETPPVPCPSGRGTLAPGSGYPCAMRGIIWKRDNLKREKVQCVLEGQEFTVLD
uniref:Uncharacterized protein n=1 Tax=Salmonella enterica subsp. salamae TaxID=59202 RepID=I3W4B4_SALER|nr:hypothetical protein [Salmonella enterica subsp. salamae]